MSFRYHGNYCGPGWSDGKWQQSVCSTMPGIDEFDEECRMHDCEHYRAAGRNRADRRFSDQQIGKGLKRVVAGHLVSLNRFFQGPDDNSLYYNMTNTTKTKQSKSATANKPIVRVPAPRPPGQTRNGNNSNAMQQVSVPAAIGARQLARRASKTVSTRDGVHVTTRVCIGKGATIQNNSLPSINGVQFLHPVAFGSDEIQNLARIYQRFRLLRAELEYTPAVPTSNNGEVVIISDDDPNFKLTDTESSSSFYSRSLSSYHATLTPVWCPTALDCKIDSAWKLCDNQNSTTIEEFSAGVIFFLQDGSTTAAGGFFFVNMVIEFEGMRFNPRAVISGSYQGLAQKVSSSIVNPTTGADAVLQWAGMTPGDIYCVVLSTSGATYGVGITAATLLDLATGSATINYTIIGSSIVYARSLTTTTANIFSTFDSACGSNVSDKFIYGVTTLTTSTFPQTMVTQLRNSAQPA